MITPDQVERLLLEFAERHARQYMGMPHNKYVSGACGVFALALRRFLRYHGVSEAKLGYVVVWWRDMGSKDIFVSHLLLRWHGQTWDVGGGTNALERWLEGRACFREEINWWEDVTFPHFRKIAEGCEYYPDSRTVDLEFKRLQRLHRSTYAGQAQQVRCG